MGRLRFSIAGMVILIVSLGVAFGALARPSEVWAGSLLALVMVVLGAAVLGTIYRREGRRAFWLGFALFGFGYLLLAFGPWFRTEIQPTMPTTALLNATYPRLHPEGQNGGTSVAGQLLWSVVGAQANNPSGGTMPATVGNSWTGTATMNQAGLAPVSYWIASNSNAVTIWTPTSESFGRIGHALFALIFGMIGGLLGTYFFATRDRSAPRPEPIPGVKDTA